MPVIRRQRKLQSAGRYDVAAPPPIQPLAEAATRSELREGAPRARKRAVLVAHGMGQQMPFETLVAVAEALEKIDSARRAEHGLLPAPDHAATSVQVGDQRLQRLELTLRGKDAEHAVHVYEAYWAPLTEGRVDLRDVVAFLIEAGWHGIRNGRNPFRRWAFAKVRDFEIPRSHVTHLLIALLVVVSLVVINATIASVTMAAPFLDEHKPWLTPEFFAELSAVFNLELGAGVSFGVLLWLSCVLKKAAAARPLNVAARFTFWTFVWVTLASALALGGLFTIHGVGGECLAQTAVVRGFLRAALAGPTWLRFCLWPVVIALSAGVRVVLVQFVGDVAAYVSSHKLDRFDELRNAIRERVHGVVRAIYALPAADGSGYEYDEVAIVGHSLGSVVVYDGLNRLLNDDALYRGSSADPARGQRPLDVQKRTCLLLTFGSPLDKTAFVFGNRGDKYVHEGREALAASVQPLIQDVRYRTFPWVNVYSQNDIVSGCLYLYDVPPEDPDQPTTAPGIPIDNRHDDRASTWLMAHVEYWQTDVVWECLYQAVAP
jgi:hypothetical protein